MSCDENGTSRDKVELRLAGVWSQPIRTKENETRHNDIRKELLESRASPRIWEPSRVNQ